MAVNEAKRALLPAGAKLMMEGREGTETIKNFDFVVYGDGGAGGVDGVEPPPLLIPATFGWGTFVLKIVFTFVKPVAIIAMACAIPANPPCAMALFAPT